MPVLDAPKSSQGCYPILTDSPSQGPCVCAAASPSQGPCAAASPQRPQYRDLSIILPLSLVRRLDGALSYPDPGAEFAELDPPKRLGEQVRELIRGVLFIFSLHALVVSCFRLALIERG
jgi:hypothetical protein